MNTKFIDASFLIALAIENDSYHKKAIEILDRAEEENQFLVTTEAILLELGNALSKRRYHRIAVEMLRQLQRDESIEILSTSEYFDQAIDLFEKCDDKDWGLVDCLSFVVMKEKGIELALTADHHFQQAGFKALMLED